MLLGVLVFFNIAVINATVFVSAVLANFTNFPFVYIFLHIFLLILYAFTVEGAPRVF
uniref:Hypothetical secreted peptide n=1 Tax=Glossina morsitans morsitans TaxID=37546 RepID=D3TSP5_GLOMM